MVSLLPQAISDRLQALKKEGRKEGRRRERHPDILESPELCGEPGTWPEKLRLSLIVVGEGTLLWAGPLQVAGPQGRVLFLFCGDSCRRVVSELCAV